MVEHIHFHRPYLGLNVVDSSFFQVPVAWPLTHRAWCQCPCVEHPTLGDLQQILVQVIFKIIKKWDICFLRCSKSLKDNWTKILVSIDWFKGKITGTSQKNHGKIDGFRLRFSLFCQPIDCSGDVENSQATNGTLAKLCDPSRSIQQQGTVIKMTFSDGTASSTT